MKNKIILFVTGFVFIMLASCLGSDDDYEYDVSRDAQIASFKLSHDSLAILADTKFTIDQIEGRIFNIDSLPYGTELLYNLYCQITFSSGLTELKIIPSALDTVYNYVDNKDSINFTKPVTLEATALDGVTKKTYTAQVNIHQVDPDTMIYHLLAENVLGGMAIREQKVIVADSDKYEGVAYFVYNELAASGSYRLFYFVPSNISFWQELSVSGLPDNGVVLSQMTRFKDNYYVPGTNGILYKSSNGLSWEIVPGITSVKAIMGVAIETLDNLSWLALVVEENNQLRFAAMSDSEQLTISTGNDGIVPDGFPLTGFGVINYNNMYHDHLYVIGGKDKNGNAINQAWSTMNALHWALIIQPDKDYFDKKSGVMATQYDNMFYLIGGIDASGTPTKDIHYSVDYGLSWTHMDSLNTKIHLPETFKARGYSSIYVDDRNYMLIFGGKTSENGNVLDEFWRGRINRLGFKD